MSNMLQKLFAKSAHGTSELAQGAIQIMMDNGERSKISAMYVAIGAVTGALQVLASLVGDNTNTDHAAECVSPDSLLLSALLVIRSSHSVHGCKDDPRAIGIDTEFCPQSFMDAMVDFQKLTGRSGDAVIGEKLAKQVRDAVAQSGGNAADALLRAVCANHRPA